ncbi:hypothetical protein GF323_04095 [Candidatus Woesearchaeota archaeon]|nr:hypothetical protein [Candidatus Woesearchaeota archaeon]
MKKTKFIGKVKLTRQGQLTLPQEARLDLGINSGCELYWYEIDGSLILVKELVNQKELLNRLKKRC